MPEPSSTSPHPDADAEDDALAERLADQWMEAARKPGIFRLHALQAAGLLPSPGRITQAELGRALGLSRSRVQQLEQRAILRTRHRLPTDL